MKKIFFIGCIILSICRQAAAQHDYLEAVKQALQEKWPKNRAINLVFHGHSVPAGYFNTPHVHTLDAYPQQVLAQLKKQYPYAVVNVIVTAIGGENSTSGAKRFKEDVLVHKPDVLFIDYALNDRKIGWEQAEKNLRKMIRQALRRKIPVILLTPSPDMATEWSKTGNELQQFAAQLPLLAKEYGIGLADAYGRFVEIAGEGKNIRDYMSQSNHPNAAGHAVIAGEVMKFFR